MKATRKKIALIAVMALACVLALSLGFTGIYAGAATSASSAGRYYSDYDSEEAVVEAGEKFNVKLASEGMVLLKNDGTLPVSAGSSVSVLGIAQDALVETSGSITESLRDAGFDVNPTLEAMYLSDGARASDFGSETALTNAQKQSLRLYNDVGIVVIARGTSGESQDRALTTDEYEDEAYLGNPTGWEHEAHETDVSGSAYKHELELTASEQELISIAEQYCKNVVVLYSSSNIFEMGNLQDDDQINAIAWIGRLGDGGIKAVGQMLCGEINPSGKVVDEWTRDFTNDPTYANAMDTAYSYTYDDGTGTSYSGLDYEEDIYLGYKFYETYWAEATAGNASPKISGTKVSADEWYDYNVLYPLGYGLSYTDFSFELEKLYTDTGVIIADGDTLSGIASSVGSEASVKTLYADVAVTNIGAVAGKEVVQVYINAPYTKGETEKAYYTLTGYTKTPEIASGKTKTVTVSFNVQDFASYDYADANGDGHTGYELDAGTYTVAIMNSSSHENVRTDAYAETTFKVASTTYLDLDDFSGGEIGNLFSDPDSDYYSMALGDETGMTLLSRADMDGTMPTAPTASQYTLSDAAVAQISKLDYIDADTFDDTGYPWYKTDADIPSNWTQGAGVADADGQYAILLKDMAGIDLYDANGNITAEWDEFMNQLTWDEIASLVNNGSHTTVAVPTIGKLATSDENGPNYTNNLTRWVGTPTVSATWNEELCEQYGMMVGNTALWQGMTGWYGPGANTHRSQFSGRTPEYFSQDGIQGGIVCAAVCRGATETGINVYVKHFALYDMSALYSGGCAQVSEQCMRENYLKIFQMCFQEGECHATMTAFNRIGSVYAGQNYALIQQLARDEWGWTGFCVTDIYMQIGNMSADGLIRAGAEFPDGDFSSNATLGLSGTWDAAYNNGQGGVLLENGYSATQWYCARMSAMRILYNEANSAGNNNGINESTIYITITAEQGQSVSQFLLPDKYADETNGYSIDSYSITSGTLPEGLEISDGYITGIVLGGGEYDLTVNMYIDGWVALDVQFTFDIKPIVNFEEDTDISTLAVGEKVDVYVLLDSSNIQYKSGYTVTVSSGSLPDGLSISERGRITGTATTAGTYTFTLAVNAVDDSTTVVVIPGWVADNIESMFGLTGDAAASMFLPGGALESYADGWGVKIVNANETYYRTFTIVVGDGSTGSGGSGATGDTGTEDAGKGIASMEINSNGELVVTYTDGTTQNLGKVVGSDGADGKDGEDGSGCGSVVATDMIWMAAIVIVALAAVLIVRKARKDRADK